MAKRLREQENTNEPAPKKQKIEQTPTEALHIQHLRRPFSIPDLKEKLGQFGTIIYFWISTNRSQCYVVYENVEEAKKVIEEMNDTVWPIGGDKLAITHCSKEFALSSTNEYYLTHPTKATKNIDELFYKTKTVPSIYWCQNEATHKRDFEKRRVVKG